MVMNSLVSEVIKTTTEIQQIPAPTFAENKRAQYVYARFQEEGLHEVTIDEPGNVYGRIPGRGEKPPLVITAHSDTVFPESTDLSLRREEGKIFGPGIGDNSLGVAGLFGILWALQMNTGREAFGRSQTDSQTASQQGDVWLVANVGEEGLGDLGGMRAVVDRFGDTPLAYLVLEGMALGQVYHRALGVQRYRVNVNTQGGHSWVDYGRPSAICELSKLINQLENIPKPSNPRTTMNVGVIAGGTSVNTIAARAHLELDLRSESAAALEELVVQATRIFRTASQSDVHVAYDVIGSRPAGSIATHHPLIKLVTKTLIKQGVKPILSVGSTDANIPLSLNLPAVCLGLTTGAGAHTLGEYINIQPLALGLSQLVAIVEGVFQEL